MKDGTYINIQWFMVDKLNLKGNELLLYAIIYGFSQEENSEYTGSLNYLAEWTKSTKKTVIETLKKLVDKNLIIKTELNKNGIRFCKYKTNWGGVKITPGVKNLHQGGVKITPNNIDDIYVSNNICIDSKKTKRTKKTKFVPPTLEQIIEYCNQRKNNVDAKRFYDYYTELNWTNSQGKPVLNWKSTMIANWESKANNNNPTTKPKNDFKKYKTLEELKQEEEEDQKKWEEYYRKLEEQKGKENFPWD